jgi:hypothetical protein
MPLVIFDGPEAAGKTTLIDALNREWGDRCIQRHWGPRDSWLEYCQPLFDDIQYCRDHPQWIVIWSRSWISRMVYNKLLSQGQSVPSEVTLELDNIVIRENGLLFLVTAPVATLASRRLARLEEGGHRPDHPLDPQLELGEFQVVTRRRKWRTLSGTAEVDQNIRTIMSLLVLKNPECRMLFQEEKINALVDVQKPLT